MMKEFEHDRERLRPTEPVKVVAENGQVLRASSEPNPFQKYNGASKHFCSRNEINAWVREMRDDQKLSA